MSSNSKVINVSYNLSQYKYKIMVKTLKSQTTLATLSFA